MTEEEFTELMDVGFNPEFLEFDRVEIKLHPKRDIHAFLLLSSLTGNLPGRIIASAAHDIIYLDVDMEILLKNATKNDITDLIRCGVMYSEEYDSLSMFA